MSIVSESSYTMNPFGNETYINRHTVLQSRISTLPMQRQLPTDEEWEQLSRLFHATAQIGTSADTPEAEIQDTGESSLEMSLNDILANVLEGIEKMDPEKALELRREFQDPSSSSTQPRPTAKPNLGTSSVHGQTIDPQGHILVNQRIQAAAPTLKCSTCQTTTTPEWRRGPSGPRTLCNACGLAWAKMVRNRARGEEEEEEEVESTSKSEPVGDGSVPGSPDPGDENEGSGT